MGGTILKKGKITQIALAGTPRQKCT